MDNENDVNYYDTYWITRFMSGVDVSSYSINSKNNTCEEIDQNKICQQMDQYSMDSQVS